MSRIYKIKPLPALMKIDNQDAKLLRVAAYARVSTNKDEQQMSFEAQKDYYTEMIKNNSEWEFAGMYSDEGVSGIGTAKRDGFNALIEEALSGTIDLILTKSISRFARNTVDTLTTVRKLKENGTIVYFEKEDMWSNDSKGEFMLTLLSSLAQEESRSISENTAWGLRRRYAEGEYSVAYSRFLGYDYGFKINDAEALIVRKIYKMIFQGYSSYAISKILTEMEIPTPGQKMQWQTSTVISILKNEKYKGDALLQKKFTADFLTKKRVKNTGELPQYYVTGGHEGIVSEDVFDEIQNILDERKEPLHGRYSGVGPLASKIICGDCNGYYGLKMNYRFRTWKCNQKCKKITSCSSSDVYEHHMEQVIGLSLLWLYKTREDLVKQVLDTVESKFNCSPIIKERIVTGRSFDTPDYEETAYILQSVVVYHGDNMNINYIDGSTYEFAVSEHTRKSKSKFLHEMFSRKRKELYEL